MEHKRVAMTKKIKPKERVRPVMGKKTLSRMTRVSLIDKVTFQQKLCEGRELIMWKFEKSMFLAEKMDCEGQCTKSFVKEEESTWVKELRRVRFSLIESFKGLPFE